MQTKYAILAATALLLAGGWYVATANRDSPKLTEQNTTATIPQGGDRVGQPTSEMSPSIARKVQRERDTEKSSERLEQLEEFADSLKDKIVVDFGTVEDIGKQTAVMLGFRKELSRLRAIKPEDRTTEEKQRLLELERENVIAMSALPEISNFQNDPSQYAQFFASLIQNAAGLDQNQRNTVHDYMKQRGESLIAANLNAAKKPANPADEASWEERRDLFHVDTAAGVANLLKPGEAKRIGFTPGFLELLEQDFDKADAQP